ncbi:hypothetical protein AB0L25_20805 [Spirillospora sp. NPDC052242]
MTSANQDAGSKYYLIPRDSEGEYIFSAEQVARDNGLTGFTQIIRSAKSSPTEGENMVLLELQHLVSGRIHLNLDSPFLVLRIDSSETRGPTSSTCRCVDTGCGMGATQIESDVRPPGRGQAQTS